MSNEKAESADFQIPALPPDPAYLDALQKLMAAQAEANEPERLLAKYPEMQKAWREATETLHRWHKAFATMLVAGRRDVGWAVQDFEELRPAGLRAVQTLVELRRVVTREMEMQGPRTIVVER